MSCVYVKVHWLSAKCGKKERKEREKNVNDLDIFSPVYAALLTGRWLVRVVKYEFLKYDDVQKGK